MREFGFKNSFPGLNTIREQLCRQLGLPTVPDSQEAAQAIVLATNTNHGESSTQAADAQMLLGFSLVEAFHMHEADEAFRRANAIYGESWSLANIGSIWALAHTNAYMVNFDLADELYEDAIWSLTRLVGGGHELTRACLTDYHQFLEGFAKDDDSASEVLLFLEMTAGAEDLREAA